MQEEMDIFGFRDVVSFSQDRGDVFPAEWFRPESQEVFHIQDPDDIIDVIVIIRHPCMSVFQDESENVIYRSTVTHGDNLGAGNHYFPGQRLAQLENTLDHFTRLTIDKTIFLTHIDDGLYLLFQLG